jgi:hypothetical protein
MSENLPKLFTTQFSTVLALKLQQRQSKLRGRVMEGQHVGKQASPDPVHRRGADAKTPPGRFAPIGPQDEDFTRRWVFPVDKDVQPAMIDNFDKLKTAIDPTSQYSDVACRRRRPRMGRPADRLPPSHPRRSASMAAAFTTETFNTGSTVTGAGYQIPRPSARRGVRPHGCQDDRGQAHLPQGAGRQEASRRPGSPTARAKADLLNQVQVVSTEFNDKPVLQDGVVTRFLGFDIVYSERLSSDGRTSAEHRWRRSRAGISASGRTTRPTSSRATTLEPALSDLHHDVVGRDAARAGPPPASALRRHLGRCRRERKEP